eukprot:1155099-Pelagomonas_calceolata.AAC.11
MLVLLEHGTCRSGLVCTYLQVSWCRGRHSTGNTMRDTRAASVANPATMPAHAHTCPMHAAMRTAMHAAMHAAMDAIITARCNACSNAHSNAHSNAVLMMHSCLHVHHGMLQCCHRSFANFSALLATLPSLQYEISASGHVVLPPLLMRLTLDQSFREESGPEGNDCT